MIEFEVSNLYTHVKAPREELRVLHELLAIKVPSYYFSKRYRIGQWDGKRKFFNLLTKTFYTGLTRFVTEELEKQNIRWSLVDKRVRPPNQNNPLILNGITLRPYQSMAVDLAVSATRGIIASPTNSGKTEIACGIIKVLGLPANFLTHRLALLHQTKERFEQRLGIEVGIVGGGERDIKDVNLLSVQTIQRKLDDPEIKELLARTPIVFSDECHRISGKTWEKTLQKCGAYFRYGLSATALLRDDISNMIVLGLLGNEITTVTPQELIAYGFSAVPTVYLFDIAGPTISKHNSFDIAYDQGIVNHTYRNSLIVSTAKRFVGLGKSVFIMVNRIAHGNLLKEMLQAVEINAPFISGEEDQAWTGEVLKAFDNKRIPCVVSSSISDEGIDVPGMDVLILGVGNKSAVKTIQRVGRSVRKKKVGENVVTIVDFMDRHNFYLKNHSIARCKVYLSLDIKLYEVMDVDWKVITEV
jgi:superfamily II DNA or RNA helicase